MNAKFRLGERVRVRQDAAQFGELVDVITPGTEVTIKTVSLRSDYPYEVVADGQHSEWFKEEQLEPLAKTLDTLAAGDIILDGDGDERKVIDVLPHSVLLSRFDNFEVAKCWYTLAELRDDGYTIKDAAPEVTELSVGQLEEKLGLAAGTLRVKKDA